jgi:hypothetical protein
MLLHMHIGLSLNVLYVIFRVWLSLAYILPIAPHFILHGFKYANCVSSVDALSVYSFQVKYFSSI